MSNVILLLYIVYMREPSDTPDGTPSEPPKNNSTVLLLLGTIADTTWRMFVPIVGLMLLGLWIDKSYDTLPWAMISLTILGIVTAAELIRRQLMSVNKK